MAIKVSKKNGFSIIELIIIIVVVVLIGVLGYVVYDNFIVKNDDAASNIKEQSPVASDVNETVPAIESVSDLTEAKSALNKIDTSSSSDSAEIDSQLSGF
jgi:Tfp pilus assembly protein PilE